MTKDIIITYGDLQGEVKYLQERVDKVTRQIKDLEEGKHLIRWRTGAVGRFTRCDTNSYPLSPARLERKDAML